MGSLVNFFDGDVRDAGASYAEPGSIARIHRSLEVYRSLRKAGNRPPVHAGIVHVGSVRISASEIPVRPVDVHAHLRPSSRSVVISPNYRVHGDKQFRRRGFFVVGERPGSRQVGPNVSGVILIDDRRGFEIEHVADHFSVYVELRVGCGFPDSHVPARYAHRPGERIQLGNDVVPCGR